MIEFSGKTIYACNKGSQKVLAYRLVYGGLVLGNHCITGHIEDLINLF